MRWKARCGDLVSEMQGVSTIKEVGQDISKHVVSRQERESLYLYLLVPLQS